MGPGASPCALAPGLRAGACDAGGAAAGRGARRAVARARRGGAQARGAAGGGARRGGGGGRRARATCARCVHDTGGCGSCMPNATIGRPAPCCRRSDLMKHAHLQLIKLARAEQPQRDQQPGADANPPAADLPPAARAGLAVLAGEWPAAEALLLAQGRVQDAVDAYKRAHRWVPHSRPPVCSLHLCPLHIEWRYAGGSGSVRACASQEPALAAKRHAPQPVPGGTTPCGWLTRHGSRVATSCARRTTSGLCQRARCAAMRGRTHACSVTAGKQATLLGATPIHATMLLQHTCPGAGLHWRTSPAHRRR